MSNQETVQRQVPPLWPGALVCSIPQAAAMIGRGTRFIYEAIATEQIKAVKSDGRTLVVVASLHEYLARQSPPKIKPMLKREPARLRAATANGDQQ